MQRGFKPIEPLKGEWELKQEHKKTFENLRSYSPTLARTLFSTGFVFANTNSSKAANVRNKSELRLKPTET